MPASMMIAETGGMPKVTGNRIAIAAEGPMPGSAPMIVPISDPSRAKRMFCGVSATEKPNSRSLTISMASETQWSRWERHAQDASEDEVDEAHRANAHTEA